MSLNFMYHFNFDFKQRRICTLFYLWYTPSGLKLKHQSALNHFKPTLQPTCT